MTFHVAFPPDATKPISIFVFHASFSADGPNKRTSLAIPLPATLSSRLESLWIFSHLSQELYCKASSALFSQGLNSARSCSNASRYENQNKRNHPVNVRTHKIHASVYVCVCVCVCVFIKLHMTALCVCVCMHVFLRGNIRDCQSSTWPAGQEKTGERSTKLRRK